LPLLGGVQRVVQRFDPTKRDGRAGGPGSAVFEGN
jgi:hypothetical protein